jgi:hypothetical protein
MLPQIQVTDTRLATGTNWLVTPAPLWYLKRHPNKKIVGLWWVKSLTTNHCYMVIRRKPVVGNGNGGHEWDCDCPDGLRDDDLCEHVQAVQRSLE